MWLLVLLFIALQPGLFITIPPVGKKLFASGNKSWATGVPATSATFVSNA
jgi:hypothetical protein